LRAIAIDGTSGTTLVCDADGLPVFPPLLYNDSRAADQLSQLRQIASPTSIVLSATSGLAKLSWFGQQPGFSQVRHCLSQADWLGFLLHGQLGISDYHNCLKLGYDARTLQFPQWLLDLPLGSEPAIRAADLLPCVVPPGTPIAPVTPAIAREYYLSPDCLVCAGTTDSNAAFIASGADTVGTAVTSLGSTLAVKLLSTTPVESSLYGIYSHRWGNCWLVGGASNVGGAMLRHFFGDDELARLSRHIDPQQSSPLDYYPLLHPGDRFPSNDPHLLPRLTPRPESDVEFLHGLLESMARIEAQGYRLLQELGATPLTHVYTAGGGAENSTWMAIRARHLQVPVEPALQTDAAFGAALLALKGSTGSSSDAWRNYVMKPQAKEAKILSAQIAPRAVMANSHALEKVVANASKV
jgi:sugar (pentulose or hexulose) kinase